MSNGVDPLWSPGHIAPTIVCYSPAIQSPAIQVQTCHMPNLTFLAAAFILSLAGAGSALAQAYPSRPVRIVVGLAAGSSTDITARIMAQKLGRALGEQFIVENRPGAGGNIATEFVAHAPRDGYTLLLGSVAMTVNVTLAAKSSFDLTKDLTPIVLLATVPNILVVHPSLEVRTLDALVALAKTKPDQIFYASSGIGTSPHLSGELFNMRAGIKLVHVPYQGSSQAINDLLAGRTSVMFSPASTALPYVASGQLIALASTQQRRATSAPDLPTMAELGVADFDTGVWFGLLTPTGTPQNVIDTLSHAANEGLKSPDMLTALRVQGIEPLGGAPEDFGAYIRTEIDKWAAVIKAAGLKK